MTDKDSRAMVNQCTLAEQTGPQTIVVRQVIGEGEKQTTFDIHVVLPDPKPSIEQIIEVFVKDVEINSVNVITDKVVVRGEFEIKTIYVAALPDQPVHAMELRHYRWTSDVVVDGARRGMDADATVDVEFVDYDCDYHTRAYKHKNFETNTNMCDDDDDCGHHHHHHHHDHDCDDDYDDGHDDHDCHDDHDYHDDHDCHDDHDDHDDHDHHHHHHHYTREFDVAVVIRVNARVLADREVMIGAAGTLPSKPKG